MAAARLLKVPVVAVDDLIRTTRQPSKDPPGISGMEPQTDPILNRLFSSASKKATCLGLISMDTRRRKITSTICRDW